EDDMSPGRELPDRRPLRGSLQGGRLDTTDLYHLELTHRSHVVVRLATGSGHEFDLRLPSRRGPTLGCACGESGSQQIRKGLAPGRYYIVVRAQNRAHGSYTLRRVDRQLTGTVLLVNGGRRAQVPSGGSVHFTLRVHPAVDGPADIRIERFDL